MSTTPEFKIGDWVMPAAFKADLIKLDEIENENGKPAYYGKVVFTLRLGILDDHGIRLFGLPDNRTRVTDPVPVDQSLFDAYIRALEKKATQRGLEAGDGELKYLGYRKQDWVNRCVRWGMSQALVSNPDFARAAAKATMHDLNERSDIVAAFSQMEEGNVQEIEDVITEIVQQIIELKSKRFPGCHISNA